MNSFIITVCEWTVIEGLLGYDDVKLFELFSRLIGLYLRILSVIRGLTTD